MAFELQRKQDQKNLQLKAADAEKSTSREMRMLAAGGFDAASQALAPVQLDGGKGGMSPGIVQRAAQAGVAGSGGKLPHLGAIQGSFGRHDVSAVKAHAGGNAAAACEDMGASAYASGNAVAFKGQPDLHTAAHEAAHIVQQRAGVSLSGGVGKSGDAYERHADQVADAVVQGKSAEGLLDKHGGGGGAGVQQQAIQMKGGLGDHLKSGAKAVSNALPGGAIWSSKATGNSVKKDHDRSGEKKKVWAMRAGSLIGQLFAPLVMAGGFFIAGTVKSYKNKKKNKKREREKLRFQQSPEGQKQVLGQRITDIMQGDSMFKACAEVKLSYMDVNTMIQHRLGLPGGKVPDWNVEEQETYLELEKVLRSKSEVISKAFAKQGLIEDEGSEVENDDPQPELEKNLVDDN